MRVTFPPGANLTAARDVMKKVVSDAQYVISEGPIPGSNATLDAAQIRERKSSARCSCGRS